MPRICSWSVLKTARRQSSFNPSTTRRRHRVFRRIVLLYGISPRERRAPPPLIGREYDELFPGSKPPLPRAGSSRRGPETASLRPLTSAAAADQEAAPGVAAGASTMLTSRRGTTTTRWTFLVP